MPNQGDFQCTLQHLPSDVISTPLEQVSSDTGCDYRGKTAEHKIKQLFGDSLTFDFSPYRGICDLVYIDGTHHYEAVARDTENEIRMVRSGGFVLWDESGNYGDHNDVTRAVIHRLGADEIVQMENTQLAVWRSRPKSDREGASKPLP